MKNVSTTLMNFLKNTATNQMCICDLLTITLVDGTAIYLTNADKDITWNGQLFSSGAGNITFDRTKTSTKIGVAVAEMDITLMANSGATIEGQPVLQYIRNAGLDAANVNLDRLFLSDWNTPIGTINNFLGRVSTLDVTRTEAKIKVKSWMVMLDLQLPKNTYQPTCLHSLYDAGCGISRSSHQYSGRVNAASTQISVMVNVGAFGVGAGTFTQGYVQFTSGTNAGQKRTVLGNDLVSLRLAMPLLNVPAIGDTFLIYPGCDHTSATCASKFNNLANFRGFEFVPAPETAL